jgi:Cu/Ag efflux protein CusF
MNVKFLSTILIASMTIGASAAEIKPVPAKPGATAPATKPLKRYPYHGNVAAVDLSAKTITLDGKKKQRVLNVTPTTRVLKDKKPVALETIKIGDYVTGSVIDTDGHLEPTTVNVGGTTPKQVAQAPANGSGQSSARSASAVNVVKPGSAATKKQ